MSLPMPAEDPRHLPNRAVIDPSAITENARAVRSMLGEHTALMAVVKADGYGHGMLDAARAALEGGATWLGVAHPASALALCNAGVDAPILTWLWEPHSARTLLPEVINAGIDVSVGSSAMLIQVSEAARTAGRRARVHLKIDTGMGRGGVLASSIDRTGRALEADDMVSLVGAWTHLASADDPDDPFTDRQVELFDGAVERLAEHVGPVPLQHLANSAAALSRPDLHRDIVRCGIALYGYPPVPGDCALRPAMTLRSSLAMVKPVAAGQTIGYGHIRTLEEPTTLGLVPIGYADGLHRAAGDKASVLVRTASGDVRAPQLGRISMDQIVVDLGTDTAAEPGDEVIVFGDAPGAPTAQDWAGAAGTIPYEVLTSVSARVPRDVRA